jgi:prevent-host-death family protein
MKPVNIADLKNNLSLYLKKVQNGEEIIVKDRHVPVAKIIPWHKEQEQDLSDLASSGMIRLGSGEIDDSFWQIDAPRVSKQVLEEIIEAERDDG